MLHSLPQSQLESLGDASSVHRGRPPSLGATSATITRIGVKSPVIHGSKRQCRATGWELHSKPQQRIHTSFHSDSNRAEALTRAVGELVDKRVIQPIGNQRGGFFSPMFVVPKGKGLMASSDQSKIPKYVPCPSPLQDGRDQNNEEPNPEG